MGQFALICQVQAQPAVRDSESSDDDEASHENANDARDTEDVLDYVTRATDHWVVQYDSSVDTYTPMDV